MSVLVLDIPRRTVGAVWRGALAFLFALLQLAVGLTRLSVRQYAMLGLAAGLVALGAVQTDSIDALRNDMRRATIAGEVEESAVPPDIVLLRHALGGFKTIFVDLVWMRAIRLHNNKEYWELYQLYDWMGKLAPNIEEIWVFNGWNMAYNIVAEVGDPEGRWSWIARSISWMRDQGLRYNPRSARIHREIAWNYYHKIGADADDYHMYYKHRHALEMQRILGEGPHHVYEMLEYPRDLEGILAYDRSVEAFFTDVARTFDLQHRADQRRAALRLLRELDEKDYMDQLDERILRVLYQRQHTEARRILRRYMAIRSLRREWRFDLNHMARIEQEYQPMDWRLPDPHAIYYALRGKDILEDRIENAHTQEQAEALENQIIDYDRIIFDSLRRLYRRGVIAYMDPAPTGQMLMTFDFSRVEQIHQMYIEHIERDQAIQDELDRVWRERRAAGHREIPQDVRGLESTKDAHVYFLQEVTENLYYSGQARRALHYFRYAQEEYHKFRRPDGTPYTLDEYALGKIRKLVTESGGRDHVRMLVHGMVRQHLMHYASLQDELAASWGFQARKFWEYYIDDTIQRAQFRLPTDQLGLETFDQIYAFTVREILRGRIPFPQLLARRLRQRLGLPDDWYEKDEREVFEGLSETDKRLREEAERKAYEPYPDPAERSFVEEEEERRRLEEERRRRAREHRH